MVPTEVQIVGRTKAQPLRGKTKHYAFLRFAETPKRIYTLVNAGEDPIPHGFRTALRAEVLVDEAKVGYTYTLTPDDIEWISVTEAAREATD